MGIFLFVLFMRLYGFHPLCLSLGKPYGGLRPLRPLESVLFLWTAAWSKILTCDNLIKSSYSIASWCYTCHCNGEAVDHLLEDVY